MSFIPLPTATLYRHALRASEMNVLNFAPDHGIARFICSSAALSRWSNKGEMQI